MEKLGQVKIFLTIKYLVIEHICEPIREKPHTVTTKTIIVKFHPQVDKEMVGQER